MDFHAYGEVYLGGAWFTTDARFHKPRIGRIKVSCGQDAVDGAFSTIFGGANLAWFEVDVGNPEFGNRRSRVGQVAEIKGCPLAQVLNALSRAFQFAGNRFDII